MTFVGNVGETPINVYYIEKKDGKNIQKEEIDKAKKDLKRTLDKTFAENSEYSNNKINEYSRLIESQVNSNEIYLGGKIEKCSLEIIRLDKETAEGIIKETSYISIISDKNSNLEETKIKNETVHKITFVKEKGEWKVDQIKIESMKI